MKYCFHNDEINTKGAQLIFNTHNPIFLNNSLLRRDEIKFVEKGDTGSILYSLSDFGTNGRKGVRNTEDYMKNYLYNEKWDRNVEKFLIMCYNFLVYFLYIGR